MTVAAAVDRRSDQDRALAWRARDRARLWSATYKALYGPSRGEYVPGVGADQLPADVASERMSREQLVARPDHLRRLLVPLVRDADRMGLVEKDADFRALVIAAAVDIAGPRVTYDEALRSLRDEDGRPIDATGELLTAEGALRALKRLLAPGELLIVEPAKIELAGGVSTISKRARFQVRVDAIKELLNPDNWFNLGPFFEAVGAVPGRKAGRGEEGWSGLFEEKFVVAWSRFRLQSYHTFLHVDYTVAADRVRTDYSLAYEVDDQIERDNGFIEVKGIPGRLGWCEYYAEKAMRFRSPQANMLAPMIMLVFLESSLWAIEDVVIDKDIEREQIAASKSSK